MKTKLLKGICLLLAVITLLSLPLSASGANVGFKDVKEDFWGYSAITAAAEAGLVNGKSTNADGSANYAPNDTMTRAEFLTTILRFFYPEEAAAAKAGAKWWTGYYDLAIAKGVLKAAELDSGDLDKAMTREEMALVLYRTAPSMGAYKSTKKASVKSIPDYKSVTNAYKDAVLWVYGAALIQGMDENGTFAPQNSVTRAQSATILAKLVHAGNFNVENLIPTQDVADTTENRQKALLEYAWAYYYKNPYVQYDTSNLCKVGRRYYGARTSARMNASPEIAGEHRTLFAHCQFYTYCCVYQAFDHEILGSWEECYATPIAENDSLVAPYNVFLYTCTGDEAVDLAAMQRMFDICQPGDLISFTRTKTTTPHIIIWAGDVTGDGIDDLLHVGGDAYDTESMQEIREKDGAVWLNTTRWSCTGIKDYFANKAESYDYFPTLKTIAVLRYTDEKHAKTDPLTERAKTRVLYPGLDISYTVEGGIFASVVKGQRLTYTLKIKNNSTQDHKGIQVNVPVPENAKMVTADGSGVKNAPVHWTVDIPAGGTVTHTYTVEATGNVGDIINSGTGYVHAIPLPTYTTAITSAKTDAAKVKSALDAAKGKTGEEFLNAYLASANPGVTIPTLSTLRSALFADTKRDGTAVIELKPLKDVAAEYESLAKMEIPYFFGGQLVATECDSLRVKELRSEDLETGDILIWQETASDAAFVSVCYDGTLYYADGGQLKTLKQRDLDRVIRYNFFIALRPTQAQ